MLFVYSLSSHYTYQDQKKKLCSNSHADIICELKSSLFIKTFQSDAEWIHQGVQDHQQDLIIDGQVPDTKPDLAIREQQME